MKSIKYAFVFLMITTQSCAQSDTSNIPLDRMEFKNVLEANSYYDIVEKLIEARFSDKKTAILEKMGGPSDSVRIIEDKIREMEEKILAENALFIQWERDHRDGKNFASERNKKELETRDRIMLITPRLETLKWRKVFYQRELRKQELILSDLDKQEEKEISQAKNNRWTALVRMYRA